MFYDMIPYPYVRLGAQLACLIAIVLKFRGWPPAVLGALGFGILILCDAAMRTEHLLVANRDPETLLQVISWGYMGAYLLIFVGVVSLRRHAVLSTVTPHETPLSARLACPKCGHVNLGGALRCKDCGRSLMPLPFAVLTLLALLFIPLLGVGAGIGIGQEPRLIFALVWAIAGTVIVLGLRFGKYWAWVAVQVFWAFGLAMSVSGAIVLEADARVLPLIVGAVLVEVLIHALLWVYLYAPRVRAFCSVGKWPDS